MKKAHELVTTGTAGSPGFPRATVLTAYFVLFLVIGLSCHHPRAIRKHCRLLDVSVETSEPHDFTVRRWRVRQRAIGVYRIPRPTSVTIAIRPHVGAERCGFC